MSDMRTITNSTPGATDQYVEQVRQKIGTEFSDRKASGKKNELGKDDFIKLMSAQLKHQDPLTPVKNEQMAAQLAQFSALEQMVNVNTNLEKMAAGQKPQENVLAASLIGKKVMTDSSKFHLQKGAQPEVKFVLPQDASSVSVSLVDAKGEIIREYDLGNMARGNQSVRWDGKNGKSQEVAPGEYSYRVNALDAEGRPLTINTSTSGLVSGVTFEGGKALLMVDDKKIPMDAIGRIEADQGGANSLAQAKQPDLSQAGQEKITQPSKNNLQEELEPEKIKNMLSALSQPSKMDSSSQSPAAEEGKLPYPLWNPGSL